MLQCTFRQSASLKTGQDQTAATGRNIPFLFLCNPDNLIFQFAALGNSFLSQRRCNLRVAEGDRVLLEGPSGGGKSTLAAILIGLRVPESGLLMAGGLDHHTLGAEGWRRRIASAPQFTRFSRILT